MTTPTQQTDRLRVAKITPSRFDSNTGRVVHGPAVFIATRGTCIEGRGETREQAIARLEEAEREAKR